MNERHATTGAALGDPHRDSAKSVVGRRRRVRSFAAAVLVAGSLGSAACSTDDEPDVENPADPEVPIDVNVDDGVDTDVEQPGNLNFDVEQPDFDD